MAPRPVGRGAMVLKVGGGSVGGLDAVWRHRVTCQPTVWLSNLNLDAFGRDPDHDAGDPLGNDGGVRYSNPGDLIARLPHRTPCSSPSLYA
jgi:hypothetical protein